MINTTEERDNSERKENTEEKENTENSEEEKKRDKVTIVCLSDTHTRHKSIAVPAGDILIHSGDFCNFGEKEEIEDFNEWLGTLPHKTKIVTSGNHEAPVLRNLSLKNLLYNALEQESIIVNESKIFGTKFQWPSNVRVPSYDIIPCDTQVLVTHVPPKGYLDWGGGCPMILDKVKSISPILHVFGRYGKKQGVGEFSKTLFVNGAMVLGDKLNGPPIVVTI